MEKVWKIGDIITIPITAFGNGAGTAHDVLVTITYPNGVSFLDFGDPGNYTDNGTDGEWDLGDQNVNPLTTPGFEETENIRFTVTDPDALLANDEVVWEITMTGTDLDQTNNRITYVIPGVPCTEVMDCVNTNISQFKQVWVDSEYGNDTTGALEKFTLPYQTIQAALTAIDNATDSEAWTVNIRGYFEGIQAPLLVPNKCIMNFENVTVEDDFIFDDVAGGIDVAYITGLIRTESVNHVIEIACTEVFVLDKLRLINNGTADIIQDDLMIVYSMNVATNSTAGLSNLVIVGDSFQYMPALK